MNDEQFAQCAPTHPESLTDYQAWYALLQKWNARINLVAPNSLSEFWDRHALDSAQILPMIPDAAQTIVDFGSGAGFPGLAVAIEAKHRRLNRMVYLIESVGKKASFLKSVSRETSLPSVIHSARIETLPSLNADIVTARAFAPLHRLLPLAWQHLGQGGQLVLLKGQAVERELAEAANDWTFTPQRTASLSKDGGCVLQISDLSPA